MTRIKYCIALLISLLSTNLLAEVNKNMLFTLLDLHNNPEELCKIAKDKNAQVILNNGTGKNYRFNIDQCAKNKIRSLTVVLSTKQWARFTCYEEEYKLYNHNESSYFDFGDNIFAYFNFNVLKPTNIDDLKYNWYKNTCDMSTAENYSDTIELQIDVTSLLIDLKQKSQY